MPRRPTGFFAFTVIWLGQLQSVLGTRMTTFVLGIVLWKQTGDATPLAVVSVLNFGATLVFSPLAGSLVDRLGRRTTIVISDIGCGVTTALLLASFVIGSPQAWEIYVASALTGSFLAFQYPAYSAVITQMMKKQHYARASAMLSLSNSVPAIFAPTLAAVVMGMVSVNVILAVDVISFALAVGLVFLVAIPEREADEEREERGSVLRDTVVGVRYFLERPGLLRLQGVSWMISLLSAMGWILLTPMIMARSGGSETEVGLVQSVGAIGGVVGGVLVSAVASPRRKVPWIMAAGLVFNIAGRVFLGLSDSILLWSIAWFGAWLAIPFFEGYIQAILQEKVEPAVQGRVFAARQMTEMLAMPVGIGAAALMADHFLEPRMMPGEGLADVFGFAVGTGAGAGMALVFVITGLIGVAVSVAGWLSPELRRLEDGLGDEDADDQPTGTVPVGAS
jgi:MFS family permease